MGGSRVYKTQETHSATVRMLGYPECVLDAAIVIARLASCGLGLLPSQCCTHSLLPDACGVQEADDERNVDDLADVQEVHVKERRNTKAYLSKKQVTEVAKSR